MRFSLMTYNVHSCIGIDKKASPERIAEVIAAQRPDVAALQELDMGLSRSGMIDQAETIAGYLNMNFHFHPSFGMEEGYYGNAVFSRYPMRLVKAGELPSLPHRRLPEKRGAIWVKIWVGDTHLNLINTHLGLARREREVQSDMILGPEWLNGPACGRPVILCGDLNASPLSGVYRKIVRRLDDVQRRINGHRPLRTWPGVLPMRRIDHIFVSGDISVKGIRVPHTALMRAASDHLPLVGNLEIS